MYARSVTPSSSEIISNLKATVESLITEFQQIQLSIQMIRDADSLERLEIELHAKSTKLADLMSAMKLQEVLNGDELNESEKILILIRYYLHSR